jgi:hypothetical protein
MHMQLLMLGVASKGEQPKVEHTILKNLLRPNFHLSRPVQSRVLPPISLALDRQFLPCRPMMLIEL